MEGEGQKQSSAKDSRDDTRLLVDLPSKVAHNEDWNRYVGRYEAVDVPASVVTVAEEDGESLRPN